MIALNAKSRFDILQAVKSGAGFCLLHWRYLFATGTIAIAADIVTTLALQMIPHEFTMLEAFLCNLPATAISAWLMAITTRLAILNEKITDGGKNLIAAAERQEDLHLCILIWLVFNMGFIFVISGLDWAGRMVETANTAGTEPPPAAAVIGMLLIGAAFWAARFSVAHLLAAVGYPIKKFIFMVNGPGFSFRLIAMALVIFIPCFSIFRVVLGALAPALDGSANIGGLTFFAITVVTGLFNFFITILTTASAAFALKEMLGREGA